MCMQICGESNALIFREAAKVGVARAAFISVADYKLPGLSCSLSAPRHNSRFKPSLWTKGGVLASVDDTDMQWPSWDCCAASDLGDRERFTSSIYISLWEHPSHDRLIGKGVPSVSSCFSLVYNVL